jgi:CubicO group peptidase (beta-lactamase class C family)
MPQTSIQKKRSETMAYQIKSNCLKCSLLLGFLLNFQFVFGQFDFSGIDGILQKNQKALGGDLVALVWKDDKIVYQKSLGEFTSKTPAPIASCSKWLTAALIMIFVDEGKLSLDEPLGKYLPIFEKYMKGYITLRHCLTHTTGIESDAIGVRSIVQRTRYSSLEEEVNAFASKREIIANPGKEFFYNNIGLNIAGRVLEVITKKSFDRVAQEKLFRPLSMRSTSFHNEGRAVNPSGGATSTANDYMNFLIMLLNKGMFNGKRILSEKAITEMETQQIVDVTIKFTPKIAEGYGYGLGEWIQEKDEQGKVEVVSSPGLFGTWPFIDLKRNYACILFVKSLLAEQKKDTYLQLKDEIDAVIR